MRLLIVTQTVDRDDPVLGFFHVWIERLAQKAERVIVICLKEGRHELPNNVRVLSLGKEKVKLRLRSRWSLILFNRVVYWWRFRTYIRQYANEYDGVFIHMNPEYAIFGGHFWRAHGKKTLLWYTHKAVNRRLRMAEKRVDKIFTASKESFRLASHKVEVVGHGIPVEFFSASSERPLGDDEPWILWVGRITPSKDIETVLKAIGILQKNRDMPRIHCRIVGSPITAADESYAASLKEQANALRLSDTDTVGLRNARRYAEMPDIYHRYHMLVHTSRTGSMDKTVLEAMASGLHIVTSSEAFADLGDLVHRFHPNDHRELAVSIEKIISSGMMEQRNENGIAYVRQHHNLDTLVGKIIGYLSKSV